MEMLPSDWFTEFEMEVEADHVLIDGMDHFDDLTPESYAALYDEGFQQTFGTFNDTNEASDICYERPTKQLKPSTTIDSCNSDITEKRSSTEAVSFPDVTCYENRVSSPNPKDYAPTSGGKNKKSDKLSNKPPGTLEHVIAERKRREKLSQQFIALSALVPDLKKMDKASVLENCMKYVKHLQMRVNELEEQTSKKTIESAVFVKKTQVSPDTESLCLTDESSSDFSIKQLPEIEARISDENVVIRIHCEKRKGAVAHILLEIEKINLSVVSSSVLPFGSSTVAVTVLAQMNTGCNMTVKELVKNLGSSIV